MLWLENDFNRQVFFITCHCCKKKISYFLAGKMSEIGINKCMRKLSCPVCPIIKEHNAVACPYHCICKPCWKHKFVTSASSVRLFESTNRAESTNRVIFCWIPSSQHII